MIESGAAASAARVCCRPAAAAAFNPPPMVWPVSPPLNNRSHLRLLLGQQLKQVGLELIAAGRAVGLGVTGGAAAAAVVLLLLLSSWIGRRDGVAEAQHRLARHHGARARAAGGHWGAHACCGRSSLLESEGKQGQRAEERRGAIWGGA